MDERLAESFRARRRGAVMVLRVLCALPALWLLQHALMPRVSYTTRVTLIAPEGPAPVDLGPVRVELRDRALALVPVDGAGRDRTDQPKVVARDLVRSAHVYQRLREMERSGRVLLSLGARPAAGQLVLPQDSWHLDIVTTSDYTQQVGRRVGGLLVGLLLIGLAVLYLPRLVYVLWPDR
ncbi:MAG: hypothetical protein RMK29_02730 [Myxococcales bacterium]|nr:hypothetical protein [Myxococcota bacterium]MDW8280597.1 hypothetical protein [Myxococcales bacterium]